MPEWWDGSRVVAWSRRVHRRMQAIAAQSATRQRLLAWRHEWRTLNRRQVLGLFTGACLLGFGVSALVWGRTLTVREIVIRSVVLVMGWAVVLRCAGSAGK
mgnify:CR=1 FL=1